MGSLRWQRKGQLNAPTTRPRPGPKPSAPQAGPFTKTGQTVTTVRLGASYWPAVVANLDNHRVCGPLQRHLGGGIGPSVLGSVGERLLHGAVDDEVELSRQIHRQSGLVHRDLEVRGPSGQLDQPLGCQPAPPARWSALFELFQVWLSADPGPLDSWEEGDGQRS